MSPMNKIRALILTFVLALVGLVAVGSNVASAGGTVPDGDCSTTAVAGSRVCYDISAQMLYVYTDATNIYASTQNRFPIAPPPAEAPQTGAPPVPFYIYNQPSTASLGGWLAWDWECNSDWWTTKFNYGGLNTVTWYRNAIGGTQPWYMMTSWDDWVSDVVTWVVNSNSGYECVVVN